MYIMNEQKMVGEWKEGKRIRWLNNKEIEKLRSEQRLFFLL
jgi:hypothetical protein